MQNPIAGFLTDPKYSVVRHVAVAGAALLAINILQAIAHIDFGAWTQLIDLVAIGLVRYLTTYSS